MDQNIASLYVLLVEPSAIQRKIIIQQFEDLGIANFTEVETGGEAMSIIEVDTPDLVISAMFLDDMTGKDLVLEMRAYNNSINIPFMLISTETSFAELDPIKQAGASAVLPKPFKAVDLRRAVLATMDWNNPDKIDLDDVALSSLRVLVVDDSALARKMIVKTLEKMGIEHFIEAVDGKEAMTLVQENELDLIITDYNMPKADGHELIKFIRTESNQKDIPVLMVTTEGDDGKLEAVQQEGVSAIVDKPFDVNTVKQLIEAVFNVSH
ncbi:MAG: response regulator [Gammaproteobacteria bacterium]|nr:response regulator [Gammaproteobacteria bacterium]